MAPLREAKTRAGMKSVNAWLPEKLHKALAQARVDDGIAINQAIREAVELCLKHRKAERRKRRTR
jgi:hypothetical protein